MLMFLVIIYRLFAVVVSAVLVDNFNTGRVAGIFDNTDVATEGASDAHTIRVNAEERRIQTGAPAVRQA